MNVYNCEAKEERCWYHNMIQVGDTVVVRSNCGEYEFNEFPICYVGNGYIQIQCTNYRTSINLTDGKFPVRGKRLDELLEFVEYRPRNSKNWMKGASEYNANKDSSEGIW